MARVDSESWEGSDPAIAWETNEGDGCTLDDANAGPGSLPANGGTQCLEIIKGTGNVLVLAQHDNGSVMDVCYIRVYIYVDTHNIGTNGNLDHIMAFGNVDYSGAGNSVGLKLSTVGTQLVLGPNYHIAVGWQNMTTANISVDTWYCVEFRLDVTNSVVAWRLNGSEIQSISSVTLDRGGARYYILGVPYTNNTPTATIFYDMFATDNADWVGLEVAAGGGTSRVNILNNYYTQLRGN